MTQQKAFQVLALLPLMLAATLFCGLAQAQTPVSIKSWAVDMGANIEYHYRVTNLTKTRSIMSVSIGNGGKQADEPMAEISKKPELSIYPTGSYWSDPSEFGDDRGYRSRLGGTFISPPGWEASILGYGKRQAKFSVDWSNEIQDGPNGPSIEPGQTFNFSVTVPKRSVLERNPNVIYASHGSDPYMAKLFPVGDPAYLNGHFTVGFDAEPSTKEGPVFWHYTGQMEALVAPPSP